MYSMNTKCIQLLQYAFIYNKLYSITSICIHINQNVFKYIELLVQFLFFPFRSFVIVVIKVMTCRKAQGGFSRKVKAPVILLDI